MESIVVYSKKYNKYIVDDNGIEYIKNLSIPKVIEDEININMNYEELKKYAFDSKINLNCEEISNYLSEFKKNYSKEPLNYYNKYISILKNKCIKLFNIFDYFIYNRSPLDTEESTLGDIGKLDVNIEKKGKMEYTDFIRLLKALVENFKDLCKMLKEANDLDSYLFFSLSKKMNNNALPYEELQLYNLVFNDYRGYVPFSPRQIEQIIDGNESDKYTYSLVNRKV